MAISTYKIFLMQKSSPGTTWTKLVDIKEWKVYCALRGMCAGCGGASRTLQLIVERTLKDQVDERIQVIPV